MIALASVPTALVLALSMTPAASAAPDALVKCTITGTSGDDVLTGTSGDDVICGRGGDDVLKGKGGDDILIGGPGEDALIGGGGRDILAQASGSGLTTRGDSGSWSFGFLIETLDAIGEARLYGLTLSTRERFQQCLQGSNEIGEIKIGGIVRTTDIHWVTVTDYILPPDPRLPDDEPTALCDDTVVTLAGRESTMNVFPDRFTCTNCVAGLIQEKPRYIRVVRWTFHD